MADDLFRNYRHVILDFLSSVSYFPTYLRRSIGNAAIDFPIKVLYDFRTSLLPPHLRARNFLSVFQDEGIGQVRVRIGFGFVIIGGVWRFRITAVRSRPQRSNVKQVHHSLMVLLRGHRYRRWQRAKSVRSLNNRIERRLWLARSIKKERVIGSSFDGPIVQPGISIGNTPKSYPVDRLAVSQINAKQVGVTLRQRLLGRLRHTVGIWVQLRRGHDIHWIIGARLRCSRQHVDVELSDIDLDSETFKRPNGRVFIGDRRPVNPIMVLQANRRKRNSFGFQFLDQLNRAFAFRRQFQIIVVIVQLRVWIGFVRKLEGLGQIIFANDFHPRRLAHRSVLI